jgi:hypothetical protein
VRNPDLEAPSGDTYLSRCLQMFVTYSFEQCVTHNAQLTQCCHDTCKHFLSVLEWDHWALGVHVLSCTQLSGSLPPRPWVRNRTRRLDFTYCASGVRFVECGLGYCVSGSVQRSSRPDCSLISRGCPSQAPLWKSTTNVLHCFNTDLVIPATWLWVRASVTFSD